MSSAKSGEEVLVRLGCQDGDDIVTSDQDDFRFLIETGGRHVELIRP